MIGDYHGQNNYANNISTTEGNSSWHSIIVSVLFIANIIVSIYCDHLAYLLQLSNHKILYLLNGYYLRSHFFE